MSTPLDDWINQDSGTTRNSMQYFPGDGTTTAWEFNFAGGYIEAGDVKAYIYRGASGLTVPVSPVVLLGPNTIQVVPAVPTGDMLVVYRDTPKSQPLVDFATGAVLNEDNLDTMAKQAVFAAAEMVDRFASVQSSSTDAVERSFTALTTAQQAASDATAAVSTANAANATAGAAQTAANAAVTTANAAKTTADGIDAKAQSALDNSTAAVSTANAANTTADGIDAKATSALSNSQAAVTTANTASTTANDAKTTADGIDSKASTALSNSQNAVTTANAAQALAAAALPVHATPPTSDVGPVNVPGIGVMEWAANLGRYIPGGFLGAWDLTQPLPADLGVGLDLRSQYSLEFIGVMKAAGSTTPVRGVVELSNDGTTWGPLGAQGIQNYNDSPAISTFSVSPANAFLLSPTAAALSQCTARIVLSASIYNTPSVLWGSYYLTMADSTAGARVGTAVGSVVGPSVNAGCRIRVRIEYPGAGAATVDAGIVVLRRVC